MKILKYFLFSCLFLMNNDSFLADAEYPRDVVLDYDLLHYAILGDIPSLDTIIKTKNGIDIRYAGEPLLTRILSIGFAQYGNLFDSNMLKKKLEAAKYLIEKGAYVNCCNDSGLSPFLFAVNKFISHFDPFYIYDISFDIDFNKLRFNFIEFLISRKANLNAKDKYGRNCLVYAIYNDDKELIEFLCSLGVVTEQMYKQALEFYQKDNKAEAEFSSSGASTAAGIHVGSEGAAEAEAQAAQKQLPVLDPKKEELLNIIRIYLNYGNGQLSNIVNQNFIRSNGAQVPNVAKIVTDYIIKQA